MQLPHLTVLRAGNQLLRRLSRTSHAQLRGHVHLFLAKWCPLSDKSAVNMFGNVNAAHSTVVEDLPEVRLLPAAWSCFCNACGPSWPYGEHIHWHVDVHQECRECLLILEELHTGHCPVTIMYAPSPARIDARIVRVALENPTEVDLFPDCDGSA